MDIPENQNIPKHAQRAAIFVNDQGGAELFGISKSHFRRLVSKGELPQGRRLGRRRIWLVAELLEES